MYKYCIYMYIYKFTHPHPQIFNHILDLDPIIQARYRHRLLLTEKVNRTLDPCKWTGNKSGLTFSEGGWGSAGISTMLPCV